jgi:hypothetical protein
VCRELPHCVHPNADQRMRRFERYHVFPTISQPSLTLPTRSFSLTQYRRGRLPLSQRTYLWHLMISEALIESHLK